MNPQLRMNKCKDKNNRFEVAVRGSSIPFKARMMTMKCQEDENKVGIAAPGSSASSCCQETQMLMQNYSNFKRSSEPARFMFYEDGSWVDYQEEVMEVLKSGFLGGMSMIETQIRGLDCLVDFYRMLEIELESGEQRSISWIDVNGKCFFPKLFVSSAENDEEHDFVNRDDNLRENGVAVKINCSPVNSEDLEYKAVKLAKRKREEDLEKEKSEGSSSNVNALRRQMVGSESQSIRWPKARILGAEEKGYGKVKNLFLAGLVTVDPGAKITAIHQCVRRGFWDMARSHMFTKQIEIVKQARGKSNLVFAWHGTSAKGIESILMHGFRMPSNASPAEAHGAGIYLSPVGSPQSSAILSEIDENGEKHVILCRVILGNCKKVELGSSQSHPSSLGDDGGVDDLRNLKCNAVWHANMNTHILPEYVVSYRPANMSDVNKFPNLSALGKLLSELKSFLPMPEFQHLQTLCESYREGKLAKNVFMQQLRSAVREDILLSTFQELCGSK